MNNKIKNFEETTSAALRETEKTKLAQIFPEAVREDGSINLNTLVDILGDNSFNSEKEDRYRFEWPGKTEARRISQSATSATIRPQKQKSVNWNDTQHLYIEGDNLEVLKILQKAYAEQIQMIYLDPPYNTGKDFVYKDNFSDSQRNYFNLTGQISGEGVKTTTNVESNGRFHTDWLNMMYSRLRLARNFLTEDGVIFISIDENELFNLKKIMDELFGEQNFVANLNWRKKSGANDAKDIAVTTESILVFAKNKDFAVEHDTFRVDPESRNEARFKLEDEYVAERGNYYLDTLDRGGLQYSDSMNYGIQLPDGTKLFPNGRATFENDGWIWKWSEEKVRWGIEHGFIEFVQNKNGDWTVKYKVYQKVDNAGQPKEAGSKYSDVITSPLNTQGTTDIANLFDKKKPFSNPKPVALIKHLINIVDKPNLKVMDFFSGSATTYQAVIEMNASDGGERQAILVQLPENLDENLKGAKGSAKATIQTAIKILDESNSTHTLTNIAEERMRRAGAKISGLAPETDTGFKVFSLDSSNIKVWDSSMRSDQQTLVFEDENVVEGRTDEDILFEILIKKGISLEVEIDQYTEGTTRIFDVGQGLLYVVTGKHADTNTFNLIINKHSEYSKNGNIFTSNVIFLDESFDVVSEKLQSVSNLINAGFNPDDIESI